MEKKGYVVRKLWLYFRLGHGSYVSFTLSFFNFILLAYRFLIEPNLEQFSLIGNLTTFGIVFVIIYVPIAILIGYWHRVTQLKVELDLRFTRNTFLAKIMRTLLDSKLGKVKENEIEKLENYLQKISEKGFISTDDEEK